MINSLRRTAAGFAVLIALVLTALGSMVATSGPAQANVVVKQGWWDDWTLAACAVAPATGPIGSSAGFACERFGIVDHSYVPNDDPNAMRLGVVTGPGGLGGGALGVTGRAAGASGPGAGLTSWLGAAGIGLGTAYTVNGVTGDLIDAIPLHQEFWSNLFAGKCIGSAFICPEGMPEGTTLDIWADAFPDTPHPTSVAGSVVSFTDVTIDAATDVMIDYQTTCTVGVSGSWDVGPGLTLPQWCVTNDASFGGYMRDGVWPRANPEMWFLCRNVTSSTASAGQNAHIPPGGLVWVTANPGVTTSRYGLPVGGGNIAPKQYGVCGNQQRVANFDPVAVEIGTIGGCQVPAGTVGNRWSHRCYMPDVLELGAGLSMGDLADLVQLDIEQKCRDVATGSLATSMLIGGVGTRQMVTEACPPGTEFDSMDVHGSMMGQDIGELASIEYGNVSQAVLDQLADGALLGVRVNGQDCSYGRAGCAMWWDNPDATCMLGSLTLSKARCEILRWAYVSPTGASTSPANPYGPPVPDLGDGVRPRPWPPEVPLPVTEPISYPPGYAPVPPSVVPEVPASCPATGHPLEDGLSPAAANVWRCTVLEYPGFDLTSGLRPDADPWSDHKTGNAADIAPWPAWDTTAGNQAGWDAAHWLAANATELGVRYVIFDHWRWPSYQGTNQWVPYKHPSGLSNPSYDHENHIHVSVGSGPQPDPREDYGDNPAPEPGPGEGGQPNPDPESPFPGTGTNPNPEDGFGDCLGAGWSWNPVSWVYTPVKCSLSWAFVPSQTATETATSTVQTAVGTSGVGPWVTALGPYADAFDQPVPPCEGPMVPIPVPGALGGGQFDVYPASTCTQPMAGLAAVFKTGMALMVAAGGAFGATRAVAAGFGYNGVPDGGSGDA